VNGGTAKYQEAFFTPQFLQEFPAHAEHVAKLQRLMFDQVKCKKNQCVNKGLSLPSEAREEVEILIAFVGKWVTSRVRLSPLSPRTPLVLEG